MLINKVVKSAVVSGLLLWAGSAVAQSVGNSPYSRIGLGDYNPNLGGIRQQSMGGVGVAAPNGWSVNELNPALVYYTARTTYEAVITGQVRTVKNATASNRNGSATLGYLALSVPINKRWATSLGLKPVSGVSYETNPVQGVSGDPTAQTYVQRKGTGGLSEVYFAHGVHLFRDLNIGATASYVFGVIDQTTGTIIVPNGTDVLSLPQVLDHYETRYSSFAFRAGVHYRHRFSDKLNLNLGTVYSFQEKLKGSLSQKQERRDAAGNVLDSLTVNTVKGYTTLPALLQVGVSLDNDKNWTASLDIAQQQWSKFTTLDQAARSYNSLNNTMRIGLGGELTPDPGSVDHYFRRVTYRLGLSVAQLPYRPQGQTMYDRAVSWGFAFPLPTATPLDATTISLGFTYGMRGNTNSFGSLGESNVQENYIRAQFGVTLNNRWFIKRLLQ